MNKNAVVLQVYYWACEHNIPDHEIQDFIKALGLDMSDLNDISLNYKEKGSPAPVTLAFN